MSEALLDQFLEETADQGSAAHQQPEFTPKPSSALKRLNYSHDALINMIIANPGISQNQLAASIGYSASWISQVMSSDAFQAKLAARSAELIDPTLRQTVEDNLKGIMHRSLAILNEKLSASPEKVPDNLALRSLEVASRALGYGASQQTVAVQVNVENHLEDLGSRLTKLLQKKKTEARADIELLTQELP
ncbi:unnamed protein product [Sphagnum balticum]